MEHREDCKQCALVQEMKMILASNRPPVQKLRAVELAVYRRRRRNGRCISGRKDGPYSRERRWEIHGDPEMMRPSPATRAGSAGSRARS